MSTDRNTATYRRWFDEGCSRGNIDLVDELYAPEYVTHAVGPDLPPNRKGLKLFIGALRTGLPDLTCPIDDLVAQGDRVAGRLSIQGTHLGPLFGMAPTGKRVHVAVMVFARFGPDGQWLEDWACWDQMGLLQQIGPAAAP